MASSSNSCGAFDAIIPSASSFVASSFGTKHMLLCDVFINHCGQDTKHTLASNFYNSLKSRGLRVFLDKDELKLGDLLPKALEDAMASASIYIAIFSEHYAQSPWCLAELEFMVKSCKTIIPVFYHVDPSDLRWAVRGKQKYANAFSEREEKDRYAPDVLQRWKEALQEASCCIGGIIKNSDDEKKVVKDVVNHVIKVMKKVSLEGPDASVRNVDMIALQSDGSSKTTLARKFFNKIGSAMDRLCRLTRKSGKSGREEDSDEELDKQLAVVVQTVRKFSCADLIMATNNFSEYEIIGQGGFGTVYRGTLPGTNQAVAIKRMSAKGNQGQREYVSEVIINSNLTHRSIVKLLGWCHQKRDRFLVYELLPNGSLDRYIFGNPERVLDWDKRYTIACDVASALVYLHHDRRESVLHRDVKASNVMLDSDFRAKLGDFGLARELNPGKEVLDTRLPGTSRSMESDFLLGSASREAGMEEYNSLPAGTLGYMAPDFMLTGKVSRTVDVYSFGVLALSIACGRPPVDKNLDDHIYSLVEWVRELYTEQRIVDAADEKLGKNFNVEQMKRLMLVGLWCCHSDPNARPSMKQVLDTLERGDELPHIPRDNPWHDFINSPLTSDTTTPPTQSFSILDGGNDEDDHLSESHLTHQRLQAISVKNQKNKAIVLESSNFFVGSTSGS